MARRRHKQTQKTVDMVAILGARHRGLVTGRFALGLIGDAFARAASETTLSGGPGDTRRNVAKGWIEKQMDANSRYRITLAGEAALKAKFQTAA